VDRKQISGAIAVFLIELNLYKMVYRIGHIAGIGEDVFVWSEQSSSIVLS
jgi:hypothetical protein